MWTICTWTEPKKGYLKLYCTLKIEIGTIVVSQEFFRSKLLLE